MNPILKHFMDYRGINWVVLMAIVALAMLLGMWINSCMDDERQAPLFGDVAYGTEE